MSKLYKILTPEEWAVFQQEKVFKGSPLDQRDNFIHLSLEHQYRPVLENFFKGVEAVVLIEIDPQLLAANTLKIEANKPGGECFPHLYSTIPLSAVVDHQDMDLTASK